MDGYEECGEGSLPSPISIPTADAIYDENLLSGQALTFENYGVALEDRQEWEIENTGNYSE